MRCSKNRDLPRYAGAGLNQARVDQARADAERDALRTAIQQQVDELAEVTGRFDAQQQSLAD